MKIQNKKAFYDYFVVESYVAGLMLVGSEVKSIRASDVNINDAYIVFNGKEIIVKNMRIAKYKDATYLNHDEMRDKKLLLNKKEITKISKYMTEKGIAIIPLELFDQNNLFKLKIGICKGKKSWNKKEAIKLKDIEREIKRDNGFNI